MAECIYFIHPPPGDFADTMTGIAILEAPDEDAARRLMEEGSRDRRGLLPR